MTITFYVVTINSVVLFSQAQAQQRHLKIIEQAIQRHGLPMVFSDPASSDHQREHVGRAMAHERHMNEKAMEELRRNIRVFDAGIEYEV